MIDLICQPTDLSARLEPLIQAMAREPLLPEDAESPPSIPREQLQPVLKKFLALLVRAEDFRRAGQKIPLEKEEFAEFGADGFQLINALHDWLDYLALETEPAARHLSNIQLAGILARQGARIDKLERVVDSIAQFANQTRDRTALEQLSSVIASIIGAVPEHVKQDTDKRDFFRPWRILLVNYAIVATRTHNPELMWRAIGQLETSLPEEMPQFCMEGMQQMEALNYPRAVREVMRYYHARWQSVKIH